MLKQRLINHIAINLDGSASMRPHKTQVPVLVDATVQHLKKKSIDMDQETRLSIWMFGHKIENLIFDQDVMRVGTIKDQYTANGSGTKLCESVMVSIRDSKQLPEIHGDHAFLIYTWTDGEENSSTQDSKADLPDTLLKLPDHWTVATMVPDQQGISQARRFGFYPDCIKSWDATSSVGLEAASATFNAAMDDYMILRSKGVRGTRSFFSPTVTAATAAQIISKAPALAARQYNLLPVRQVEEIRPFVERNLGSYTLGSAYYELTKSETVQAGKRVLVQHRGTGRVYSDGRQHLGFPNQELTVRPSDHNDWRIFIQSTSVNRHLMPGTQVLVLK